MEQQETYGEKRDTYKVYYSILMERSIPETGANALFNVCQIAGANGFIRIGVPYMRVDWARNMITQAFCEQSDNPNDMLIMLDCDHQHPNDILPKLALHPTDLGVVGALAFRRGKPHEGMFFVRDPATNVLRSPANWDQGCYEVDAVGTGAIAIRRWVFDKLDEAGFTWPYFRFEYPPECGFNKSEDIVFCESCEKAGVTMYCNTSIVTPHLIEKVVDDKTWFGEYREKAMLEDFGDQPKPGQAPIKAAMPKIVTALASV